MKSFQKLSLNFICTLSLITMVGCVPLVIGAIAGAGGVTYVKGALVHNVGNTVDETNTAVIEALKELYLFVVSDEVSKRSAITKAEYDSGKSILVRVDALTERSSKITIRVGTFGDQEESQTILNAILRKL